MKNTSLYIFLFLLLSSAMCESDEDKDPSDNVFSSPSIDLQNSQRDFCDALVRSGKSLFIQAIVEEDGFPVREVGFVINYITTGREPYIIQDTITTFTAPPYQLNYNTSEFLEDSAYVSAYVWDENDELGESLNNFNVFLYDKDIYSTVSDIEGNVYKTGVIGGTHWMLENLRSSKLNDNTSLPEYLEASEWQFGSPGYGYYDENIKLRDSIGGFYYNYAAVESGKLCPQGWRVPTRRDFEVLEDFLRCDWPLYDQSNTKLDPASILASGVWAGYENNTDPYKFSLYPTGRIMLSGAYSGFGNQSWLWASDKREVSGQLFQQFFLSFADYGLVGTGENENQGALCVRCVKDANL